MCFLLLWLRPIWPLTAFQLQTILQGARCTPVYRYDRVFARDPGGQEYYLCQCQQLATLTIQHGRVLLQDALSYRLR